MDFCHYLNCVLTLFTGLFLGAFLPFSAQGIDLKLVPKFSATPPTPEPSNDKTVETKEAMVDIDGTRYREIQYQGKNYYLKSLEREPLPTEALECMTLQTEKQKMLSPHYLYGELSSSRRSQSFLYRLQNDCEIQPDVPHPAKPVKGIKSSSYDDGGTGEGHIVSHPVDQEVGISFDSKQHRSKGTNSTPGGTDGGID